jgi:hypothetical protein
LIGVRCVQARLGLTKEMLDWPYPRHNAQQKVKKIKIKLLGWICRNFGSRPCDDEYTPTTRQQVVAQSPFMSDATRF